MKGTLGALLGNLTCVALAALLLGLAVDAALPPQKALWIAAVATALGYTVVLAILWKRVDAWARALFGVAWLVGLLACDGARFGTLASAGTFSVAGYGADRLAAATLAALLLLGLGSVAVARRVNLALKLVVAALVAYACLPLLVSLAHAAGLQAAASTNAPLPSNPGVLRGTYVAAVALFPLATVVAFVVAIAAAARKRDLLAQRAFAAALAFAFATQTSGLEAAVAAAGPVIAYVPTISGAAGASGVDAAATIVPATSVTPVPGASGPVTAQSPAVSCLPGPGIIPSGGNPGSAAAKALTSALGAFAGAATPTAAASPSASPEAFPLQADRFRAAARNIPCEAYDVAGLAATLPADPAAIDIFVRDHVGTASYAGALRGAAQTWLGRSGNDVDKALLLAALLHAKGFASQFVSAPIDAVDAASLAAPDVAAPSPFPVASPPPDGVDATKAVDATNAMIDAALPHADAIAGALRAGGARLTNDPTRAPASSATHWWIRVATGGTTVDLDPSLARLQPGRHLGSAGAATADRLADNAYAGISVRLIGVYGTGSNADVRVLDTTKGHLSDVGTQPIRVAVLPQTQGADPASATTFVPYAGLGDAVTAGTAFGLTDPANRALSEVRLEIVTTQPGRPARTSTRWILAPGTAASDAGLHLCGLSTMTIADAPFNVAFATAALLDADAQVIDRRVHPGADQARLVYPIRGLQFLANDALAGMLLTKRLGAQFEYDRPRIIIERVGYDRQNGAMVMADSFDIVENAMAARGDRGAYANVVRGIVDTQIERDALGAGATGAFDALTKSDHELHGVTAAAASGPGYLGLQQTFDRGAIALGAPTNDGASAVWWDVDPNGGATVGRTTGGAGQAIVEYAFLVLNGALEALSIADAYQKCSGGSTGNCGAAICSAVLGAVTLFAGGLQIANELAAAQKTALLGAGSNAVGFLGGAGSTAGGFGLGAMCGG